MKLIVIENDGTRFEWEDVISYDFIDNDYAQEVAAEYGAVLNAKQLNAFQTVKIYGG